MNNNFRHKFLVLLFAIELIIFIVLCFHFFPFTPDDGYIYLYGARQLAGGELPNYTPGEPPTNPFGSPLWLILLTPPYLLDLSSLIWAKLLGLLLLILTACVIGKILRSLLGGLERTWAYALSFSILCLPFMVACAVNVLDTLLATASLIVSLYFIIRCMQGENAWLKAGLAIGVLIVSRPDAFIDAMILVIVLLAVLKPLKEKGRQLALFFAGMLPGVLLFVFTAILYKDILPNSAIVKIPGPGDLFSYQAIKYMFSIFIRDFGRDAILFLIYTSLILFYRLQTKKAIGILFAALSLTHLAIFLVAKDWMGIHRLYLPSITVAICAFFFVIITLLEKDRRILLFVTLAIFLMPMGFSHWKYYLGYNYSYPDSPSERMGEFIAENKLPDSWLMTCDMGVVPYYAEIPSIDSNDAPICNRWRRNHVDDGQYIFNRNLDFIIMINHKADGRGRPVFIINRLVWSSPFFQDNYVHIGTATWRPSIEDHQARGFSIGYGRYFHLYVSKRIWDRLNTKDFTIF